MRSRIAGQGRAGSGTAFLMRCETNIGLALDRPELSPRELAVSFIHAESYFVSEASVYRLLKAHDLTTSPAFIVIKAADAFRDQTTAPKPAVAPTLPISR